jgi:hypothetical protein
MFPPDCSIERSGLTPEWVKGLVKYGLVVPCLNPSHAATINVMRERFGINIEIPARAPVVSLSLGDSVIVMGVSGLPRLEGRHEYTQDEINGAVFEFSRFRVTRTPNEGLSG